VTSRERVCLTLDHEEPDRVPLDVGVNPDADELYCARLGITSPKNPYDLWHEELMRRLRVDYRWPWPPYSGPKLQKYPDGSYDTEWGIRRGGHGLGYAMNHPLAEATMEEIESYPLPSPDWYDYTGLETYCEEHRQYAIMGGAWSPFWLVATELMGMQNLLCNMAAAPELVHALLKRIVAFFMAFSERCFESARGKIDIFFMGDDYGFEHDLLMSPEMWRAFCAPHLRRLLSAARGCGVKYCMLHSCGSVVKIIPDLIEMGFDALDPIQPEASGMNPSEIKMKFGGTLALHGTVSLRNLSKGTQESVVGEVRERLETLMPGGGVTLGPTNWLLQETPFENVLAFYDTVSTLGGYR